MHEAVLSWVGQFRSRDNLAVLDIGGRDLNGSTRMFFPNASPYHVLDLRPGPNVDIVTDAATWTPVFSDGVPDAGYDLVLCTETFEHAEKWREIIATAWAALRSGGWFVFTCAGPGRPPHSGIAPQWELIGDEYYGNVSPEEIREELEQQGWTKIEARLLGTDTQGCAVKPLPRFKVTGSIAAQAPDPREVLLSTSLPRTKVSA